MKLRIEGLVAAPFTPFRGDGSLNPSAIAAQAELLAADGVVGAFVCGSTGESMSLTTTERQAVAAEWCRVRPAGMRVIVHVGHTSLREVRELAAHAQACGADAIGMMPPFFFKPTDIATLTACLAEAADAAPKLPLYYYHIPALTGVSVRVSELLRAAGERIPTLNGAKFTFEDLMDLSECVGLENGRYDILFGRDEMLLAGLATGCRGAVGSTYNFAAPLYLRLMDAFSNGDSSAARAAQARSIELIRLLIARPAGLLSAAKALMSFHGVELGPVRLPLTTTSAEDLPALRRALDAIGYFEPGLFR